MALSYSAGKTLAAIVGPGNIGTDAALAEGAAIATKRLWS